MKEYLSCSFDGLNDRTRHDARRHATDADAKAVAVGRPRDSLDPLLRHPHRTL